jgi:hypothetical protein
MKICRKFYQNTSLVGFMKKLKLRSSYVSSELGACQSAL